MIIIEDFILLQKTEIFLAFTKIIIFFEDYEKFKYLLVVKNTGNLSLYKDLNYTIHLIYIK